MLRRNAATRRIGNDPENLSRIYFLYDDTEHRIVICLLPNHLTAVKVKKSVFTGDSCFKNLTDLLFFAVFTPELLDIWIIEDYPFLLTCINLPWRKCPLLSVLLGSGSIRKFQKG